MGRDGGSTGAIPNRRRIGGVLIGVIGLLPWLSLCAGCARVPKLAKNLQPTLLWNQKTETPAPFTDLPSVQANAPTTTSAAQPDTSIAASEAEPAAIVKVHVEAPPVPEVDYDAEGLTAETASDMDGVRTVGHRNAELKAALNGDAARTADEAAAERARHPLRLRAESLTHRARQLMALGELADARRAAQQAVELSDSAHLEYLPSEERPRDLLRTIETALKRRHDAPVPLETIVPVQTADGLLEQMVPATRPNAAPHRSSSTVPPGTVQLQPLAREVGPLGPNPEPEAVRMAANRPVSLGRIAADEASSEPVPAHDPDSNNPVAHDPSVIELLPDLTREATPTVITADADLPLPALPPFRGETFPGQGPALVPEQAGVWAPPPPALEAVEPLASVKAPANTRPAVPVITVPVRPLLSTRAVIDAAAALGVLCCLTGAGLMLRHLRERV